MAKNIQNILLMLKFELAEKIFYLKARLWHNGFLMWWGKLYIRDNEFHPSLRINVSAMLVMNPKQKQRYISDLLRRRGIAHQRSLQTNKAPANH
ncbi:MAG: hypothetical protein COU22_02945 [Candidatus Komeilibacteria bacterium CG10_big_fil_rev_8_21_14_0_10_41_13]|uniref:Uncharacterized protein n=1 Tax=Candidatus Komeilibacteria bacterium CG10_big_fil_rev_8_21_14_0_10_41_13 TaxID=1974476 RepID=A0A2M6WBX7_9BACT|nr:MAG: hypothetical protein COU22_02945 [Candidatus Komeilibacteria bacterium CG10_big_fil_rev_8_21_14_0_10_41_13]